MKQKKPVVRLLVLSSLLLCYSTFLSVANAQPAISATNHQANTGDAVTVSIDVTDYNKILSTQFTLNWDPSVIQYKSVSNFGLNVREQDNFGRNNVATGELTFFWYDPTLSGVSVADDKPLFDISFDVVGATGSCTTIAFTDSPTVREVVDTSAKKVDATFINGEIVVGQQCLNVSAENLTKDHVDFGKAFPNPTDTGVSMPVYAAHASDAFIRVFDAMGKQIRQISRKIGAGEQIINLSKETFPQPGIYHIQIQINEQYYTHKLVVL